MAGDSPGTGWVLTTRGDDCNDEDPTITTQCKPSTCKDCPTVTNEVAIVDLILPENTADYGYVDSKGNVYIKSEDGTYKKPSQLNPNSAVDRKALNEIAASLARNLDGSNKNIVISNTEGDKLASKNPAWTRTPPGTLIFLNSKGGFSKDLNNVNAFKNIIKHEIIHVDNKIKGVPSNLSTHADVYIKSFTHISFKDAPDPYKLAVIKSLANYILNMDKRADAYYTPATIKDKIESFNLLHLRYRLVVPYDYNTRGQLTISIKDTFTYDGPEPFTNYDPIKDEK